jgi:hypothetical protein
MPGDQDRRHRHVEQPRPPDRPPRVRLDHDRPATEHLDQVAVKTGPVQRQPGSLFESDQSTAAPGSALPAPGGNILPATHARPTPHAEKAPRIRWAWRLVALALTLAVGMVLGLALGSGRVGLEPTHAPVRHPPATQPATAPVTSVVIRPTASSACLETARRADEIIQLLITKRRTGAAKLLIAYTVASRQCRRDAAP